MAFIYDIADTWNASGTTFKGIALNVTDTASAAGSLLMDLQVGGSSRVSVSKAGLLAFGVAGETTAPNISGNIVLSLFASNSVQINRASGSFGVTVDHASSRLSLFQSYSIQFAAGNSAPDLILTRDAANTLAQRNGVNAQAFNLYNTYTDASNYERARVAWVSNGLVIGTQPAGTGTARGISLDVGGTGTSLNLGGGVITFINAALNLGGTTSAFPALKRSTTSMQVRLADDSAFTNIQGKLTTDTEYTAGAPTATGYIVLFDRTGTAYRVPAVAN